MHEQAKKNFNTKADDLLLKMKKYEVEAVQKNTSKHHTDEIVSHKITSKDIIGEIQFGITNGFGDDLGKYFRHDDAYWGIYGHDYEELKRIASNVYRIREIKSKVSYKYVKDRLFEWTKKKFMDLCIEDFCEYLEKEISSVVKAYEIWIPIPYTKIDIPINIGNIEFKNITKSFFDERFTDTNEKITEEQKEKVLIFQNSLRKEYQGFMAGVISLVSERTRAEEIAYEEVAISLSILRVFSEANFIFEKHNSSYEYAYNSIRTKRNFMFENQSDAMHYNSSLVDGSIIWIINSKTTSNMKKQIDKLNPILTANEKTEFQMKVIEVLITYSKNILRHDISDRVLYILVALESLLLRNSSEPIQQNVGERLAFAIADSAEKRMKITKNIRDIYAHRSKFVHHGYEIDMEGQVLREFMLNAWCLFQLLFSLADKFETKEQYLDSLDLKKYT